MPFGSSARGARRARAPCALAATVRRATKLPARQRVHASTVAGHEVVRARERAVAVAADRSGAATVRAGVGATTSAVQRIALRIDAAVPALRRASGAGEPARPARAHLSGRAGLSAQTAVLGVETHVDAAVSALGGPWSAQLRGRGVGGPAIAERGVRQRDVRRSAVRQGVLGRGGRAAACRYEHPRANHHDACNGSDKPHAPSFSTSLE